MGSFGATASGLAFIGAGASALASLARVSAAYYGAPAAAMHTVGVTGTNGKTTTTYLLRAIFEIPALAILTALDALQASRIPLRSGETTELTTPMFHRCRSSGASVRPSSDTPAPPASPSPPDPASGEHSTT